MIKLRLLMLSISCILIYLIYWSSTINFELSTNVEGEIIPSGKVRKIQNLEGGIIKKINVSEGSIVNSGDIIIELERVKSQSEIGEIKTRIAFLEAEIITIRSIIKKNKPKYSKYLTKNYPEIVEASELQYKSILESKLSQKKLLNGKIGSEKEKKYAERSLINGKINQNQNTIKIAENKLKDRKLKLKDRKEALELIQKQIDIGKDLLKENIISELQLLEMQGTKQAIKSDINDTNSEINDTNQFIDELKSEIKNLNLEIKSKDKIYNTEIKNLSLEILVNEKKLNEELSEKFHFYVEEKQKFTTRLERYEDQLGRKFLTSPINGTVKKMNFFTIGGVVKPGEEIIEIVPMNETLIIEAKLPVSEIGYIKVGQETIVRLGGTDGVIFNPINGKVSLISPDTIKANDNENFYMIQIKTDASKFSNKNRDYLLYPGLKVNCNIIVGERSLLENLLAPFLYVNSKALTEHVWMGNNSIPNFNEIFNN